MITTIICRPVGENVGLKSLKLESKCKFTVKEVVAQLSPLLELAYTYFYRAAIFNDF